MVKPQPIILGIESSCDDTAAAVLRGLEELGYSIASQNDIHNRFGGVVPEIASRNHTMALPNVVADALSRAGLSMSDIDAVAVTTQPGLAGALLVGTSYARALAYALQVPLIEVDHIRAHIAANFIAEPTLSAPLVAIVASGGHTSLIAVDEHLNHQLVDATADDALGELFDKVGRVLGLPYPAGAHIDRLAQSGSNTIKFLRANRIQALSFSGLKTAAIQYIRKCQQRGEEYRIEDVCASLTVQACQTLLDKAIAATKQSGWRTIVLAGGVASNSYLREQLRLRAEQEGIKVFAPPPRLCTDNASMVAAQAFLQNYLHNNTKK